MLLQSRAWAVRKYGSRQIVSCMQKPSDSANAMFTTLREIVLPKTNHSPAQILQLPGDAPISRLIPCDLCLPKLPVANRYPAVQRTTMPEAAIYKHSEAPLTKNKVRLTWKSLTSTPAGNTRMTQQINETQFRRLVVNAPNTRHHLRPLTLTPNINHLLPSSLSRRP